MEFFKDGKYIIGFLVGIICSFIVMGGVNNYKDGDVAVEVDGDQLNKDVLVNETEVGDPETLTVNVNENGSVETVPTFSNNQSVLSPETPHSPELQRLALILRETDKIVDRLKKEMRAIEIKQQTASLLSQLQ